MLKKIQQQNDGQGGRIMTNTVLLYDKIKNSGLKLGFIAEKLGLSYEALRKKLQGKTAFKAIEIKILCDLLNIVDLKEKEHIFFANDVENYSTNDYEK